MFHPAYVGAWRTTVHETAEVDFSLTIVKRLLPRERAVKIATDRWASMDAAC